jgi:uncharacterized protein (TIGR02453 family)
MATAIKKETIQFLKDLKKHNDREWFNAHKDKFVAANENFIEFVQELIGQISRFDKSVSTMTAKDAVFRIYRDTRFSKDKTPYKTHFGASLMPKKNGCGCAGYYFHMDPAETFLAGGVHMAETAQVKALRQEIAYNADRFKKIINDKTFKQNFELRGEQLKNVPPGYDKEDPMAEYLKYKSMWITHKVAGKDIVSDGFAAYCAKIFKTMVPFNTFINEAMDVG